MADTNAKTTKVTTKTAENAVQKATEIVAQEEQEEAKVSFADKRLMKAQEQAAEGHYFRAGINRIIGKVAKHPVATAIGVGVVGGAGFVGGYLVGVNSASSDSSDIIEGDKDEFAEEVEVVDNTAE